MRPVEYEFSKETKLEALNRAGWCCERCGIYKEETFEGYLEIHHVVGISLAIHYYPELAPVLISSLANARVLCEKCHTIEDVEDRKKHKENVTKLKAMMAAV